MKPLPGTGGTEDPKLNKAHPELAPFKDEKDRRTTRPAPIVWEMLRRHPEVARLRGELAAFLVPGPMHRVLFNEEANTIIQKLGFGLELLLTVCGLNAWVSETEHPSDWSAVKPGAWPLDVYPKRKFEQLMPAYCYARRSPCYGPGSESEVDLTQMARHYAEVLKEMSVPEPQEIDRGDSLFSITRDAWEQKLLRMYLRSHAESGYQISIVARDPAAVDHPAARSPSV